MATAKGAVDGAKRQAAQAIDNVWVERLARLGYIARGILYIVIGLVSLGVVLGTRAAPKDTTGAIAEVASQPYGKFLLVVLALGLAGYAAWGLIRGIWDPLNRGSDTKGLLARAGFVGSGISYAFLCVTVVGFLQGHPAAKGQTQQTQDLTARALQMPGGKWIVLLVGLIVLAIGIYQIYYAYKADFKKDLRPTGLSGQEKDWAMKLGQWGYGARGVIFALIGVFIMQAALTLDPKKAQGLDGALAALSHQAYGPLLLGVVALGLIAFGVFSVLCARWYKVDLGKV